MRTEDSDGLPAVRISDLDDLVHLVPTLLGFHPRDSLALILISGGRVLVTARVDLDAVPGEVDLAAALAPLWEGHEPGLCAAIAYGRLEAACLALDAVADVLPADWALARAVVDGDRWCEPWCGAWRPYDPASSRITAEAVYRGRPLLPDRGALASLLGDGGGAAAAVAVERVLGLPPDEIVRAGTALWEGLSAEPRAVDADEAALLAVAAHAPGLTWRVLAALDRHTALSQRALWADVVHAVPLEVGLAATGLVGLAGWVDGDGALANVCLERAAPWADGCPWYRFLDAVTSGGVHPDEWASLRDELWPPRAA